MINIESIILAIHNKLNIELLIDKELDKKSTARSLQKYILVDKNNKKYLLEIANNSIEIFYFKRTIEYQEKLSKLEHNFKLNMPLYKMVGNKLSYALYEYFENISFLKNVKPVEKLIEFYKKNSIEIGTTDENIEKILSNFLSAWPNQFHAMITRQKEFQDYKKALKEYKSIQVSYEHGDYTTNNIFNYKSELYLMDFEFARDFQPIGFDIFDYAISVKGISKYKQQILYETLHSLKYKLIEVINKKVDENDINIEIYHSLDDTILQTNWRDFYNKGSNYNLSFDWCFVWMKHFKKEYWKTFIFTIWDNDTLVFLAPLYLNKNNLYLIGSNPDLFDNFDLLYIDEKYIKQFYDFIFRNNYNIDLRYLDSESVISKFLVKYLYQNKIDYDSEIIDTKPITNLDTFKVKAKENSDIKRCKNRAIKNYNEKLQFSFSVEKDNNTMNEFIAIHKERWSGGPFQNIKNYDLFIKDISKTDLVILSKLSIQEKTVAYHFGYKDSNDILNSAIPSYSNKYNDISPGKVLLYEVLNYCKNNNDKFFDFGRGAEDYKYWFSNESKVLFNLKTTNSKNLLIKVQKFCNRVFNKLYRVFYV